MLSQGGNGLRVWPRSLLGRLILVVLMIDGIAGALCGLVIIFQARSATAIEIESALRVAELLVTDTIGIMKDAQARMLLQTIELQSRTVRHVRATVTDADGARIQVGSASATPSDTAFESHAPAAFARLIAPAPRVKEVPVLLRNHVVGSVRLASEPADEIDEAWHYASALLIAGLCLSLAIIAALILVFGRVLAPLTKLAAGLEGLERRDYAIRLPQPQLQELAVLTAHFNRTAHALEAAHTANATLNRKLLTAQDDERRRTALELHDEVGPCLFALDVEASSIVTITGRAPDATGAHERAKEILSLVKQVQVINRRLLDRLRPMGLGRIPLSECLCRILVDLERDGGPVIDHAIGPLADTYDLVVDLTVYRCVQEGLLNAVRHARATRIALTVREMSSSGEERRIEITIDDDGSGFEPATRSGRGISGMRERVEALMGRFVLTTSSRGTELRIVVPLVAGQTIAQKAEAVMG